MAITTEAFVTRFHSINGITIGERRKNLFLLLNGINRTHNLNFSKLLPKTALEEKFKVETLIYFKKIPELLEVLKCENPILIKKILKIPWFLQEAFADITGEQLVTEIFPNISYNTKLKLLNKLALHLKNAEQGDEYFQGIAKNYGVYLASMLLPACTSTIIKDYLSNGNKLRPRQVLSIIKKDLELAESCFNAIEICLYYTYDGTNIGQGYKNILVYLSQHDVELFCQLHEEHNSKFRLGRGRTTKFIQINREDIIENPRDYYKFLHKEEMIKSLNQDFKMFYRNLFPKSLIDLESKDPIFRFTQELPENIRNLLFTTFEEVYGTDLWDYEEYRKMELLEMLSPNEREAIMDRGQKPGSLSEEEWFSYKKTEISVPYLQNAISLTSNTSQREKLVRLLVKTCQLNHDKTALLDVSKYMLIKHRNDHCNVRNEFLTRLKWDFRLEDLDEEHWIIIKKLIQVFFACKNETFYYSTEFREQYIHFRLKHNLPIRDYLTELLLERKLYTEMNIIQEQAEYEKKCLLLFGEIIPELFKIKEGEKLEESDLHKCALTFNTAIIEWNQRNPNNTISIVSYPYLLNSITHHLTEDDDRYLNKSVITNCLKYEINFKETRKLLNLYLRSKHISGGIITWLVQNEPLTIINNIEKITHSALRQYYLHEDSLFFWKWLRNYAHLENYQKVISICIDEFEKNNKEGLQISSIAVTALSYLISPEEFLKFFGPYYPSNLRGDAKTAENKRMYDVQSYLGSSLKNLNPPSSALESILILCKGDYLKFILSSLYSASSNANEDKVIPILNELAGRAVSVRKHAIHLAFSILNKKQMYSMLKKFMETEKNVSVRKYLFKAIFNFFILNPVDYSWNLLTLNVKEVDITDKEAIEMLIQKEKIPPQFRIRYILFTWNFLQTLPASGKESRMNSLLDSVTTDQIKLLPKEFCNEIIEKYFFQSNDALLTDLHSTMHSFTAKYILSFDSEKRLKLYFEMLKTFVLTMWNNFDIRCAVKKYVANFLHKFCGEFLNGNCKNTEIFIQFSNLWNGIFKPYEAFDEYLYLQFTLISIEKLTLPEIAEKLVKLLTSLAEIYELSILPAFSQNIKPFGYYFFLDLEEENWSALIEDLISIESSIYCSALAVLLLNDHKPRHTRNDTKYYNIIETIKKIPEPAIQLYLENHLTGNY